MSLDPSAIKYAQTMLNKGYGYQNAARIANVPEADLREVLGAAKVRTKARTSPSPWLGPRTRKERVSAIVLAQTAMDLSGPSRVIIHDVAKKYGLTVADIIGEETLRPIAMARQEAMFRVRVERPLLSLPAIGKIFGGRDHTTIIHGIRKHEARMAWAEVLIAAGNVSDQLDLFERAA